MICGSLTWLKDYEKHRIKVLEESINETNNEAQDDDGDDWISAAHRKREAQDEKHTLKQELSFLLEKIEKMKDLKKRRQKIYRKEYNKIDADFDELFRDAKEVQEAVKKEIQAMQSGFSAEENDHILDDYQSEDEEDPGFNHEQEEKRDFSLRLFYCSRTHSQLSQFVKEIQKTSFSEDIRLVSLASRSNMCINDSVLALKNPYLINERCLELQKKSKSKKKDQSPPAKKVKRSKEPSSCPFYKSQLIQQLRDQTLVEVQDIEQIVTTGKSCSKVFT